MHFSLYIKPTNTFQYLLKDSNHPEFIFKNIPKSLFIRIRRICSDYTDYLYFSRLYIKQLISRGYDYDKLSKTRFLVGNLDRADILPYKIKNNNKYDYKSIKLKFNFDLNFSTIKKDFRLYFNSIQNSCLFLEKTKTKLDLTLKIEKNLKLLFVNNFKMSNFSNNRMKACNKCINCKLVYNVNHIKLGSVNIPLFSSGNCNSENCIYIITCIKCKIYYVGQTNNMRLRINNHKSYIKNFGTNFNKLTI